MTDRQTAILAYLRQRAEHNLPPPTLREIGEACDISSSSVVDYNLAALQHQGLITRSRFSSRGIILCGAQVTTATEPLPESDQSREIKRLQAALKFSQIRVKALQQEIELLKSKALP